MHMRLAAHSLYSSKKSSPLSGSSPAHLATVVVGGVASAAPVVVMVVVTCSVVLIMIVMMKEHVFFFFLSVYLSYKTKTDGEEPSFSDHMIG